MGNKKNVTSIDIIDMDKMRKENLFYLFHHKNDKLERLSKYGNKNTINYKLLVSEHGMLVDVFYCLCLWDEYKEFVLSTFNKKYTVYHKKHKP